MRSRRVGPATFHRLLGEYGSAEAAIAALPDIARAAGVTNYLPYSFAEAEREYAAGRRIGAHLLCFGEPGYPADLADVSDAPPVLWLRGNPGLLARPAVAMVGARNASSLGSRMAKLLAHDIGAAGFVVVSGLARGIDTAAHSAALATGTVAVMAGGVDHVYPRENQKLADQIAEQGAILSEQPIGLAPQARHFPRRNRIVSGLARAVIVVEAAARSGSLITARDAADQGREVMAVPGHPLDARAAGCNMLLRDGATLVRSGKDVTEALELPEPAPPRQMAMPGLAEAPKPNRPASVAAALDLSRRILTLLGPSPIPEDQLIRELDLPAQKVSGELVTLELQGKLARQSGGMLSLVV
ncbi:MAG: DNA-processing protein DprA [Rhodobacteraceae bacterium]|nr:DNA-processing protein DprA [Paracoccaceae bacterium]